MTTMTLKPQQGEPGWLHINGQIVEGEVHIPNITAAMLDNEYAGNRNEIWWHLFFIRYGKWSPADPAHPNQIRCCTGTVTDISISGDGDIGIQLTPDQSCQGLLAPGQTKLECEIPWAKRNKLRPMLLMIEINMRVKICGYFLKDSGHGATIPLLIGGSNELHPVTSISPA